MTFAEAAGIMIGGGDGSVSEPPKPELITYEDIEGPRGTIIEHYNVGTDSEYTKKIIVVFNDKGTVNEQIASLHFYDKDGKHEGSISFSGFYVG